MVGLLLSAGCEVPVASFQPNLLQAKLLAEQNSIDMQPAVSETQQARVRKLLTRNIAGFKRLARFAPYLAGERFTMADCAGYVSLPLVSMASKAIYGECLLAAGGIDWKPYIALVGQRPSAQRVTADRKRDAERTAAARTQN